MEKHKASENMQKFFANLLEVKEFVKKKAAEKKDPVLNEIYQKLDKVIKESK